MPRSDAAPNARPGGKRGQENRDQHTGQRAVTSTVDVPLIRNIFDFGIYHDSLPPTDIDVEFSSLNALDDPIAHGLCHSDFYGQGEQLP